MTESILYVNCSFCRCMQRVLWTSGVAIIESHDVFFCARRGYTITTQTHVVLSSFADADFLGAIYATIK